MSVAAALAVAGCDPQARSTAIDADRDGVAADEDCDDADPFVHPGAQEFCDGVDDDCDGAVDGPDALGQRTWYADADGDGFGAPGAASQQGCSPGPGWAPFDTDCDDADPHVHPRRDDPCNGVDDDCSGVVDDHPSERMFVDADGDGHGAPASVANPILSCEGTSRFDDDCDDADALSYPGAPELCDGRDNDCDQRGDDFDPVVDPPTWYADLDGDGYGLTDQAITVCVPPTSSWAATGGDCDDLDPTAHPGAVQLCVSRDTDCDGQPGDATGWFAPDASARIPAVVSVPGGATVQQPVLLDIDFRAALDALGDGSTFDPDTVVVAVQACADDAARALPTSVVDGLGDPFAGDDPTRPTGDERALVSFVPDHPLAAGEQLAVAVYFGGGQGDRLGSVVTTAGAITTSLLSATVDRDRGGAIDAFTAYGVRAVSQADARDGNGVYADGSWTQLGPASVTVVASDPAFGALAIDGVHAGPTGDLRVAGWLFAWDGVPALYAHLEVEASTDLAWEDPDGADPRLGLRPVQLVPLDLVAPVADGAAQYATLADAVAGVALAWVDPPSAPAELACTELGCVVAASEGQGAAGFAAAGEALVDHRVLAVVPVGGSGIDTQTLDAVRNLPTAVVGAAEPSPSEPR